MSVAGETVLDRGDHRCPYVLRGSRLARRRADVVLTWPLLSMTFDRRACTSGLSLEAPAQKQYKLPWSITETTSRVLLSLIHI